MSFIQNDKHNLYEAIEVWKRLSDTELVHYRCFRNVKTGKYTVQSSDCYSLPPDPNKITFLQKQYLELLAAIPPEERSGGFDMLAEAIDQHDGEFNHPES